MRSDDLNQMTTNTSKRQNPLRPSDLPSIQETNYKNAIKNTSNMGFLFLYLEIENDFI